MIKVLIWGIGGKMGRQIYSLLQVNDKLSLIGGIDKFADKADFKVPVFNSAEECNLVPDVIIDFSRPEAVYDILPYAVKINASVVLATTGYSDDELLYIRKTSTKIAIFQSSNMSLGVNLLLNLVRKASNFLGAGFDIEIIEHHHNMKVDSPSGTAVMIADAVNEEFADGKDFVYGRHGGDTKRKPREVGIHAVRGGTVVGKHEVMFIGNDEVITISHEAQSRRIFAVGSIKAAEFIAFKGPKLYNMEDLLFNP
jgi:4-hydroxy-tetrahydrodipicolinate reductase